MDPEKLQLGSKITLRIQLALFDGDALLERMEIVVSDSAGVDVFCLFRAAHELKGEVADITPDSFAEQVVLKSPRLQMPVHESDDQESIPREKYMFAFWRHLNA